MCFTKIEYIRKLLVKQHYFSGKLSAPDKKISPAEHVLNSIFSTAYRIAGASDVGDVKQISKNILHAGRNALFAISRRGGSTLEDSILG